MTDCADLPDRGSALTAMPSTAEHDTPRTNTHANVPQASAVEGSSTFQTAHAMKISTAA